MKRRRIAYIGCSYKFVHQSVRDYILTKCMDDTDLVLYDIDPQPLKIEYDFISRTIKENKCGLTVKKAVSRAEAIDGADYVICSLLVGGMDAAEKEDLICQKYGIRHTVGDTIGPMCAARCLRMVPLLVDIAHDMEKHCPAATMLSVTNPMSVLTNSVNRNSKINCIGVCHGTHFRLNAIAAAYKVERKDIALNVVGVNHLAFVDKIRIQGVEKSAQEVVAAICALNQPGHADIAGYQESDTWANTFARRYGVIPNNGDHHFVEFFRWFLAPSAFKNGKNIYNLDDSLHSADARRRRHNELREIVSNWTYGPEPTPPILEHGGEHMHDIILGLEGISGDIIQRELHLNLTNGRSVPNLPSNANLELTCFAGGDGMRPVMNEPLPPFTLGIITPLVCVNLLSEKAAVNRDKKAFLEALTLDPLTNDFCAIPQMAEELWAVNEPYFTPQK